MSTYVITGCNRGIGLALTSALVKQGHFVIGTCRNHEGARDLWELESLYKEQLAVCEMDVTEEEGVEKLKSFVVQKANGVDVLINNAGVGGAPSSFLETSFENIMKVMEVNLMGPINVTRALLSEVKKSSNPKVVNISSKMGSIADNSSGGSYAYRMSKAALNMFNKGFAVENPQIISVVVHPGWVKTDMGGPNAPTGVYQSAEGIIEVIKKLHSSNSGGFYDFQGNSIPW